jgi:hypothetical protein
MLKRILAFGVMFLFLTLGSVQADAPGWVKTYNVSNDTNQIVTTYVSTSILIPNQTRILAWTVMATRAYAYSSYVSLWDEKSTTAHSLSNLIGETESVTGKSEYQPFVYPRNISNQVAVVLGPYSAVTIEYTK